MSSSSKTVLITGCSEGGIGYSLAKEYHAKGFRVFATARRLSSIQKLHDLGIECLELDVTDVNNIKSTRDTVSRLTGGSLFILVNNAGQSYSLPFTDCDMQQVRALFETNVFGVMMMIQEFLPLLIASGDGRIVNIGSVVATVPLPFGATYSAAKGALHSFGNTLRVELAPFNVKVITVITGGVKSNVAAPHHRYSLPSNSIYLPMKEDFISKRQGNSQKNAMDTDAYAQSIVASTTKVSPKPWLWEGKSSYLVWFVDTFWPRTKLYDYRMTKRFGLDKFKKFIEMHKKN